MRLRVRELTKGILAFCSLRASFHMQLMQIAAPFRHEEGGAFINNTVSYILPYNGVADNADNMITDELQTEISLRIVTD